jgi:hypothetical protein
MTFDELRQLCHAEWSLFDKLTPYGFRYNRPGSSSDDIALLFEDFKEELPEAVRIVTHLLEARIKR